MTGAVGDLGALYGKNTLKRGTWKKNAYNISVKENGWKGSYK